MIKKLLIALTLLLIPALAQAQCNGVFSPNTICGTVAGGIPGQVSNSVLTGAPGGTNGQVQFNNSGVFGGLTNTQLTALINPFTSTLPGSVPASGGGTINFLRADATFAPIPVTGVTSLGGMTGAVLCGSGLNCAGGAGGTGSVLGSGSIFDAVITYGADPTGVASSTTAINNAIAAACAPGVRGIVWLRGGTYLVNGGVNATNISSGCTINGAGLSTTVLKVTTATNAILDLTGSSAVSLNNFQLTDGGSAVAQTALLLSTSGTPSSPCNVNHFKGISITGHWIKTGIYIFDCSDSSFENSQISNFTPTATSCVWISNTNDLTITSSYTTIFAGTGQSGDWRFSSFEIHDLSTFSPATVSNVIPLFISGVSSPIKFIGGVIAGSAAAAVGGNVTFGGVPTTSVSFIGTQFYADNGIPSKFAFWTFNNMNGLVVQGSSIQYGTSFLSQANGATWDGLSITGNTFSGGSFVTPTTAATITRSLFDARALAINLGAGGTLTHSVMLQPGTITAGTQTANGSF